MSFAIHQSEETREDCLRQLRVVSFACSNKTTPDFSVMLSHSKRNSNRQSSHSGLSVRTRSPPTSKRMVLKNPGRDESRGLQVQKETWSPGGERMACLMSVTETSRRHGRLAGDIYDQLSIRPADRVLSEACCHCAVAGKEHAIIGRSTSGISDANRHR